MSLLNKFFTNLHAASWSRNLNALKENTKKLFNKKKIVLSEEDVNSKTDTQTIAKDTFLEKLMLALARDSDWDENKIKEYSFAQLVEMVSVDPELEKHTFAEFKKALDNLSFAGLIDKKRKVYFIKELDKNIEEYFYKLTVNGLILAKVIDTLKSKYHLLDYSFRIKDVEVVEDGKLEVQSSKQS